MSDEESSIPRSGDQVAASIGRRASALLERSRKSGEGATAAEVEALEREARLLELARSTEGSHRPRWPAVAVFAVTLCLLSALLFLRVPQTEIELALRASGVEFVLARDEALAGFAQLDSVGASGLAGVELSGAASHPLSQASGVRLSALEREERLGSVSLAALLAPAGSEVGLRHVSALAYRLSLRHPDASLRVGVHGPVQVASTAAPAEVIEFPTPRSVVLAAAAGSLDVELVLGEGAAGDFGRQLSVSQLGLSRVDEFFELESSLVDRVSTILGGVLRFESLDGAERELRPGELLRFDELRGEIRTLALDEEGIALHFRGRVGGIETGWSEGRRSLMPTLLAWLQARHGLWLLWGASVYLFGLVFGVLRWWGVRV
ncbi:MAG: hypothetical protein QNK03_19550 [Myxococcota bacterium]|nr:hypothetical protein [Myxococcota bacterium]